MKPEHQQPLARDFWGYCNYCRGNTMVHATKYDEDNFFTQECTKCHRAVRVKIGATQGEIIGNTYENSELVE